jgi:hypothetical protein
MKEYIVKKFEGDDLYSYAVFRSKDVKSLSSPVFWGQAKPIVSGMSRREAQSTANFLMKQKAKKDNK